MLHVVLCKAQFKLKTVKGSSTLIPQVLCILVGGIRLLPGRLGAPFRLPPENIEWIYFKIKSYQKYRKLNKYK